MRNFDFAAVRSLLALVILVPASMMGQAIYLAGNYDGTEYNGSDYLVGSDSGYTYAWGAGFTVAGTGDFNLTRVTMPLYIPSAPTSDLNHFLVYVVADDGLGHPSDSIIGGFNPVGVGSTGANFSYDITGVVHGGMNYWLLFSPIAQDGGAVGWFFSMPAGSYETGYLAERWSPVGMPTGAWTVSSGFGSVRPAFRIEGTAVPEPRSGALFGLGVLGWTVTGGRLHRKNR